MEISKFGRNAFYSTQYLCKKLVAKFENRNAAKKSWEMVENLKKINFEKNKKLWGLLGATWGTRKMRNFEKNEKFGEKWENFKKKMRKLKKK